MAASYGEGLLAQIGINGLLALSVYVILATGQLTLGNAGLMAIGAYLTAVLAVKAGVPLVLALLAAGLATGAIGVAVGFPALRFRGIYLAMATLAFGEIVRTFFLNFGPTGAEQGFYGMKGVSTAFIWAWVVAVFVAILLLERTKLWLAFRAVSDDEAAAEVTGLNTTALKVGAFGLGALIAAIGGGLFAEFSLYIEPSNFDWLTSVSLVLFVILGGSTTAWGPVFGAAVLTLLPEVLRFMADWRMAIYGGLLVLVLALRPCGLLSRGMVRSVTRGPARASSWLLGLVRAPRTSKDGVRP